MQNFPLTDDVVLIGGGHTHALVLRKWGMTPVAGARLTVINPGPTAPYSGMLPGHVAGHYSRDALDIDLVRLARFANARLIVGSAVGIDLESRHVHVDAGPPIGFDLCSVDVGITSRMPTLPGFAEHATPAKPLAGLADAWRTYLNTSGPARIAVIGAGVAGVELAMAMAFALRQRNRPASITVLDRAKGLTALLPRSADKVRAAMSDLGVTLQENVEISKVTENGVEFTDGSQVAADFVTGTAGALPYGWVGDIGLKQTNGFLDVSATLQTSDPDIFAVGDCAHLAFAPRPKAGVYAVREAPILLHNLQAKLMGAALRNYRPQDDYLKLISLGGKSALGERMGLSPSGRIMWGWKDRIDQAFMNKFRELPAMAQPKLSRPHTHELAALWDGTPSCAGCGAKVARQALEPALDGPLDDAAVIQTGGAQQVISTDHVSAVTNDPALMGRIAAIHALGDIWAMGAAPQVATANFILPHMTPKLQARTLETMTRASQDVFAEAGARIVGGHTSLGETLTVGFTVTGLCAREAITLAGAQASDVLLLTKPIGAGVLLAAEMRAQARGDDIVNLFRTMTQSQAAAAEILKDAHAMTDVTGFGLAGHLLGMCDASQVSAVIDAGAVPLYPGALELSEKGVRSSLYAQNRQLTPKLPEDARTQLLFDPQTCGGLLAAVSARAADDIRAKLIAAGYGAAVIGRIQPGPPEVRLST